MTPRLLLWPALLVPLAAGCGADPVQFWHAPADLLSRGSPNQVAFPFGSRVAFIDKSSATAFVFDPGATSLAARLVPVGKGPIAAVEHKASHKLLVLGKGGTGSADESPAPAELDIIDGDPAVPVEVHPLDSRFDSLAESADGRFVVLYHRADRQGQLEGTLYDPNELLIIDYAAGAASPRMTGKSIRSLGAVPTDIVFSPPLGPLGGRRLAVVLAQSNVVTLVDLDNPERTEISIPLCDMKGAGCAIEPKQVVFDTDQLRIFVRGEGANDIFQIELRAAPQALPGNDFQASETLLTVGGAPADLVLYRNGAAAAGSTRLAVAVPATRRLVLIDPDTTRTVTVSTLIPVTRIIPYDVSPTDPSHALLLDGQYGNTSVLFAALPKVESSGSLVIEEFPIGMAVGEVVPLLEQQRVVLTSNAKGSSSTAATVVNLVAQSFRQIGAGGALANVVIEARPPSRLWGVTSGTLLTYANLGDTVGTGETRLDQPITSVDPLVEPSANGHRYLVLGHDDPATIGNVTFLDADKPDRTTARTAYGFLLTDYLEREQP